MCHGHPWVRFSNNAARCELGDFLLVHDHQPSSGPFERRAVLVQAKIFYDNGGVRHSARNALQLALYQNWPRFKYDTWPSGGLNALTALLHDNGVVAGTENLLERDLALSHGSNSPRVISSMVDTSCRYGMIEVDYLESHYVNYRRSPWRLCSSRTSPTVYTTKDGFKLGTYLARLIRGDAGRSVPTTGWPTELASACHWSLMVKELMTLNTVPASTITPAVRSLSPSASTLLFHAVRKDDQVRQGGVGGGGKAGLDEERDSEDGGFAVVVLRTSSNREERFGRLE